MHVIHIGEVGDILYKYNALNSMYVGDIGDTCFYL